MIQHNTSQNVVGRMLDKVSYVTGSDPRLLGKSVEAVLDIVIKKAKRAGAKYVALEFNDLDIVFKTGESLSNITRLYEAAVAYNYSRGIIIPDFFDRKFIEAGAYQYFIGLQSHLLRD